MSKDSATGEVIKFYPKNAAEKIDNVLEQAVGVFDRAIIIGYDKNGDFDVRASLNFVQMDIIYALDLFKHRLLNGRGDKVNSHITE